MDGAGLGHEVMVFLLLQAASEKLPPACLSRRPHGVTRVRASYTQFRRQVPSRRATSGRNNQLAVWRSSDPLFRAYPRHAQVKTEQVECNLLASECVGTLLPSTLPGLKPGLKFQPWETHVTLCMEHAVWMSGLKFYKNEIKRHKNPDAELP